MFVGSFGPGLVSRAEGQKHRKTQDQAAKELDAVQSETREQKRQESLRIEKSLVDTARQRIIHVIPGQR